MKKTILLLISIFFIFSCATITNDPNIPVSLSFSDGSSGTCDLSNKRGEWSGKVPGTFSIRRSDDSLIFNCKTNTGKKGIGEIHDTIESAKFFLGGFFLMDLGITDSITDKHRAYAGNFVIPVN